MSLQPKGPGGRPGFATLSLDYPMSLGVFEKYEDAQRAVDTLSDKAFPVENCLIVGTELKQLERVTARLTWGRVALGGLLSGIWLGLFVGLILMLFTQTSNPLNLLLLTVAYGAAFGLIWSLVGYSFTRGARDFSSVSQVVATKYEVFCEHKFAQQGRAILTEAGIVGVTRTAPAPTHAPAPAASPTTSAGTTPDDAPRTDPPAPPSA
ncbi:general stress protein [Intrasporangium flavum]|uniref:general stress protein n=1 Tax=Intrasporangium flavum TaxID=1428657 RepID=UPI001F616314|nr:general stress protein [Intrasporangium flavum]